MSEADAKQATPAAELERQIMDSNVPKNEREWWAAGEIDRLRQRLTMSKHGKRPLRKRG